MSQTLRSLDRLLRGPVRWRKGSPILDDKRRRASLAEDLRTVARITARTPEVMVRISGKAKGGKHVEEHLRYITRNGDLTAEDESGRLVMGRRMVKETAAAWMEGSALNRRSNSRDTVNIILSMPPGTDRDKLLNAARQFGREIFGAEHSYLLVRHDDTDHPHCHLTVRSLGFSGRRLNPKRDDLQAWRVVFAAACRQQGTAAEATPRRTRGVVRKPKKQAVLHADKAKRSTVQKSKVREALKAVTDPAAGLQAPDRRAVEQQAQTRADWSRVANELSQAKTSAGQELARQIRTFLAHMPRARPNGCSCRSSCASTSNNRRSYTMRSPKGRFEDPNTLQTGESGRAMRMFLMACEYGSTTVPLARCAELFGYSPDEAAKRAARAALPVPAFRCGSQKSPWLVNVEDLADYIESQRRQALQEWQRVNGATHRLS